LRASLQRKRDGARRFEGSALDICEQIVRGCFNVRQGYFMTSLTSYPELWARDFGRCVPALLSLGFEREVAQTYRYALAAYQSAGGFALVITRDQRLFDFPAYAPDGFALFVSGLKHLGDGGLVAQYRPLLNREIERFYSLVIDPKTGLVRRHTLFSEAQDYIVRDSSCYSNSACHLLQQSLDAMGLFNPLAPYDYRSLVLDRFWDGDHFLDDQSRPSYPSGDAQLMPLWAGLLGHDPAARARLDMILSWMDAQGLNSPLPTRYGVGPHPRRRMHPLHWLNPWQTDTVWTCLGLHLLEILREFDHPRFPSVLARYRTLVESLGCFPEVLDSGTGAFYASLFSMSEDSMLWAASLWRLLAERASREEAPSGAPREE